jgi:iron complex transport system substrate-binding protein
MLMPCGFNLARTGSEAKILESQPGWKNLRAVKSKSIFLADGNAYFNRPGPRIVESLEILAEILHPKLFSFGHEGKGWEWAKI